MSRHTAVGGEVEKAGRRERGRVMERREKEIVGPETNVLEDVSLLVL